MKTAKELLENLTSFQKNEDVDLDNRKPEGCFKAIIDAFKALGAGEPDVIKGEYGYEITWKTPSNLFDLTLLSNIAHLLEDELNSMEEVE